MPKRDYYIILGVSRSETAAGIHEAFRRLAKEYHPDRGGPDTTAAFQEIASAYEILSDPARRRQYDETLPVPKQIRSQPAEPKPVRGNYQAEPLIPTQFSGFSGFSTNRPSFEVLFDRLFGEFSALEYTQREPLQALDLDVVLTRFAALQGVIAPIAFPVSRICSWCGGSGREWLSLCDACNGQGSSEEYARISVRIPPGVRHGSVIELPLERAGIKDLYLRLHIRVSG